MYLPACKLFDIISDLLTKQNSMVHIMDFHWLYDSNF